MSDDLWFLGTEEELMAGVDEILLPEIGEFQSTGFIGQIQVHPGLWRLFLPIDPEQLGAEGVPTPAVASAQGSGYEYLWRTEEQAKVAAKLSGTEINPQVGLFVDMPTPTVINKEADVLDKWGAVIGGFVPANTFASKYRHEMNMMFLPSAIYTLAKLRGLTVPEPDWSDVNVSGPNFPATLELQEKLVGDCQSGLAASFEDSEYFKYRAELWVALGESNPYAMHPKNADSKLATTSDKLSLLLRFVTGGWRKPLMGRLNLVCDPRLDAESKAGNRLTVPVITELFMDKEEAEAAVLRDAEETGSTVTVTSESGLYVPQEWRDQGMAASWPAHFESIKDQEPNAILAHQAGTTLEELEKAYASAS